MGARTLSRLAVYKSWPIYGLSYRWCRVLALSSLVRLVLNNGIHQPNKPGQVGILGEYCTISINLSLPVTCDWPDEYFVLSVPRHHRDIPKNFVRSPPRCPAQQR